MKCRTKKFPVQREPQKCLIIPKKLKRNEVMRKKKSKMMLKVKPLLVFLIL